MELAAASSLMWRTGQCVGAPVPQVLEEPIMKLSGFLASCGDGTEGSGVGAHGEQVKENVGEKLGSLDLEKSRLLKLGLLGLRRTLPRQSQFAQCLP